MAGGRNDKANTEPQNVNARRSSNINNAPNNHINP